MTSHLPPKGGGGGSNLLCHWRADRYRLEILNLLNQQTTGFPLKWVPS